MLETYVNDLNGNLIAVNDSNEDTIIEYLYIGNMRLAAKIGADFYFIHTNHLDAPVALTDQSGAVVWSGQYAPFGKLINNTNLLPVDMNLRFPGQYWDQESGLHYNWHRYYDPELGRYITSDPLGLFDGPNTYAYAHNNPVMKTDPTGQFVPILVGIGVGLIFDYAVDKYKESKCGCDDSGSGFPDASTAVNAGTGAANGLFGPFATKPRVGASGGGRAGMTTSTFSQMNHAANRNGYYPTATRHRLTKFGRAASRYVPYLSTVVAGYQLYDAATCN